VIVVGVAGQEQNVMAVVPTVVVRPIASPLTLGFLALAVGTFTLAGAELSWIASAQDSYAGLGVMLFVFPLQVVSSIYGFLARDSIASTGMGLLSAAWLTTGMLTYLAPPGHAIGALGLVLLGVAVTLLAPAVVGLASKPLASLVMAGASLRFFLTGIYELSRGVPWKEAAAVEGLLLAVLAVYAAFAFELEDSRLRTVLPTFRRGAAQQAIIGTMAEELAQLHHEAGVRKQL
jgi:succinate-acetate transporter protein